MDTELGMGAGGSGSGAVGTFGLERGPTLSDLRVQDGALLLRKQAWCSHSGISSWQRFVEIILTATADKDVEVYSGWELVCPADCGQRSK